MAAASPVLQLGLLHMRPIQFWLKQRVPSAALRHGRHCVTVTRACVSALAHWRDPFWLKQGVILDTAHKRKVVTTEASNKGWGALCEGKPTFGLWPSRHLCLQRQLSLLNLFYKEHGCPGTRMAQPSALYFSLSLSATAGTQASQGTMAQADSKSPPPSGVIPAAESSFRADPLETGPPLSSKRQDMASMA